MTLLHTSISAADPQGVAEVLASILGGPALPFPPCPDAWIAFSAQDDGTAVEVYPADMTVIPGPETIAFTKTAGDGGPSFAHTAVASALSREEICRLGEARGWTTRICNRGPFDCVELWVENRLLIEVLDAAMLSDYRRGMTAPYWRAMFGMEGD